MREDVSFPDAGACHGLRRPRHPERDHRSRLTPAGTEARRPFRFFIGFCFTEGAAIQGVTEGTAQRKWEKGRIYLHRSLRVNLLS